MSPTLTKGGSVAAGRLLDHFEIVECGDLSAPSKLKEPRMKLAILGTGGVGAALGPKWGAAGHTVAYGTRDPGGAKARQLAAISGFKAAALPPREAVQEADVVVLAVPWPAAKDTIDMLGDLAGRVLIDCTNPLLADLSGIECGHLTSAAEQIAERAPGAKVVKAFNTASTKVMKNPKFGEQRATMFFCGDDAEAKAVVRKLIEDVGFEPADAGNLTAARYLEPLAMLYIDLAFKQGWGSDCAFKVMKRG